MDVLIQNGDIPGASIGGYSYISGIEEAVQRVRIAALTVRGTFIYDRELGADYASLRADDEMIVKKLDMLIKEACCDINGADVKVISFDAEDTTALISVKYRNMTSTTEVDLTGILR